MTDVSLKDADAFLREPWGGGNPLAQLCAKGTDEDVETAWRIIDVLVDRSARLAAANIAAVVIKSGKGRNPAKPVCVVCEGTTFLRTYNLRERVFAYLKEALTDRLGIHIEIAAMENAVTLGSAVAGLA
jgi:hexokinase